VSLSIQEVYKNDTKTGKRGKKKKHPKKPKNMRKLRNPYKTSPQHPETNTSH
jgi:hypothetical protein